MQLMVWDCASNYCGVNLFKNYLLSICHMLGIVLGLEYTVNQKT